MTPLTKEQALIISAYTGYLCIPFNLFHEYAEVILDRPILTHEFVDKSVMNKLKDAVFNDFLELTYIPKG